MMRALRQHSLSVFFGGIFVAALMAQSVVGLAAFNSDQAAHGLPQVTYGDFVTSSDFVVDVAENWQSEFLQFLLFILATVWLVQRGSPESKKPGDEGVGSDEVELIGEYARAESPRWAKARGIRLWLFSHSLTLLMGTIFLLSWLAQSATGSVVFNEEQAEHGLPRQSWFEYLVNPDFWNRTLQNWQSEFLAVGCMVAFSIFLRQRGSSESKPVGTPHAETSTEGE